MSMKESNQAVAEREKSADNKANGKTEYRRAAGADREFVPLRKNGQKAHDNTDEGLREGVAKGRRLLRRKKRVDPSETSAQEKARSKKRKKKARVRIFPIWLRIIIVLILAAFALASGLMIGYGVMGDGNPIDALKVETWQHIIDIVIKE